MNIKEKKLSDEMIVEQETPRIVYYSEESVKNFLDFVVYVIRNMEMEYYPYREKDLRNEIIKKIKNKANLK